MSRELLGILLDFDGTIADTERHGHRVAYNLAFAEYGLDWIWDDRLYADLLSVAGGKERMRHYIEKYQPRMPGSLTASQIIEELHLAKSRHFAKLAPAIPLRPGVLRLLREARKAGILAAIVTTALQAGVEAFLNLHPELAACIQLIAAGDVVKHKKPAPDIYHWALDGLALKAEQCVAIEDSSVGLSAALGADLPTIITVSEYTAGSDFRGAYAVLSSLGDPGDPALSFSGPRPAMGMVDLNFIQSGQAC